MLNHNRLCSARAPSGPGSKQPRFCKPVTILALFRGGNRRTLAACPALDPSLYGLPLGVLFASGVFHPALAQTAGKRDGRHQRREPRVCSNRRVLRGQASNSARERRPDQDRRRGRDGAGRRTNSSSSGRFRTTSRSTRRQDRIHYIVVTKGIPLRVRGSSGPDGSVASVDSELTLLYRKLLGVPIPPAGTNTEPLLSGRSSAFARATLFASVHTTFFW